MSVYKIKSANLIHYLPKMQGMQKAENTSDSGLSMNIDAFLPLRQDIPCGIKIRTIKENFAMDLTTVICGQENTRLGSTQLCQACYTVFKEVSSKDASFTKLPSQNPETLKIQINIEQRKTKCSAKPLSFFEKCQKVLQDHPYLTAAAVAFPVICGLIAYGAQVTPIAKDTTNQTTAKRIEITTQATAKTATTATTTQTATTKPLPQ